MSKKAYKPTALRKLEGVRSHSLPDPENVKEPQPETIIPSCPSDISEEAKKVWERLTERLNKVGLFTELDEDTLAILCQIRAFIIEIHGLIADEQNAEEKAKLEKRARLLYQLFEKYSKQFGMSPVNRVGLTIGKPKEGEGEDLLD